MASKPSSIFYEDLKSRSLSFLKNAMWSRLISCFHRLNLQRDRMEGFELLSPQISSGKYLIVDLIGFGAACPKPQIEASAIAVHNSPNNS